MKRHTQGEWIVTKSNSVKCKSELVAIVTTLSERVYEERQEGESWLAMRERIRPELEACVEEREANAKLIAAAPDLLEAGIEILNSFDSIMSAVGVIDKSEPKWDRLRKAIEKATK